MIDRSGRRRRLPVADVEAIDLQIGRAAPADPFGLVESIGS